MLRVSLPYHLSKSTEGSTMKTFASLTALLALFLSACTTTYQAPVYDDVYYSPKDKPAVVVKEQASAQQEGKYTRVTITSETETPQNTVVEEQVYDNNPVVEDGGQYVDPNATTYETNNYYSGYSDDDYYDYQYSSRLRRFHNPYQFDNYYHDYYTNNYWYSYDPYYYGSSIYLSYNWLYPSYSMFHFGWDPWYWSGPGYMGWGYNSWWYNSYYYPYFGWGGGYWNGYYQGYWDGYYAGCWDNYFNSYDPNSYYNGPREPRTVGNSPGGGGKISRNNDMNFGETYLQAV